MSERGGFAGEREVVGAGVSYAALAIRNQVVLPGCRATLPVVRPESLALLETLDLHSAQELAVFSQKDVGTPWPREADLHRTGVLARVVDFKRHEGLGLELVVEGLRRVELRVLLQRRPFLELELHAVDASSCVSQPGVGDEVLRAELLQIACALGGEEVSAEEGRRAARRATLDLGALADDLADALALSVDEQLRVLLEHDPVERARDIKRFHQLRVRQAEELRRVVLPTVDTMKEIWVLDDDAERRLAQRQAAGELSVAEVARLRAFRDQGYVVWERLIDHAEVDAFLADVEGIRERPGRYLLTDQRRARPFRASGADFDHFESVFDTYVNLHRARELCFHDEILRFLQLLFEEPPMATQQLLFQRSNEHPMHQDTAYVCMREPMLMVASWIALEDVVRGRGELSYYEGSHRIPHLRYAGDAKRFQPELDDEAAARAELLRRCESAGCTKRDFLARKGDVVIWAADLVHGSNRRTRPLEETRRSLVTHYCPESNEPLYFLRGERFRGSEVFAGRARFSSSHYRLPAQDLPARPEFPLVEPC